MLDGKRHGYGIVQDIDERTKGQIKLVPGNLYAVLHRLIVTDLLAETAATSGADLDTQRRRYYKITRLGREVAAAEARRLRELLLDARTHNLIEDIA